MQKITFSEFKKLYEVNFNAEPGDEDYLGFGGFGEVFKGYDEIRHHEVAIKKSPTKHNLLKEVEMAKSIPGHSNIARYLTCYRVEAEVGNFDVAILQFYPLGNLTQLMQNEKLTYDQIIEILKGILNGLKFFHEGFLVNDEHKRIIHRDLKPRNILITQRNGKYIPLITDFGISKLINNEDVHSTGGVDLSDQRGTISYKAPEQVHGTKSVRSNLDLWAFGVIVFELLKGHTPFTQNKELSTNEILKRITDSNLSDTFEQIKGYPAVFKELINACLVRDIKERVQSAQELIDIINKYPLNDDRIIYQEDVLRNLFEFAIPLVIEQQNCSISFLQRKLNLGYDNACIIIDKLEASGIVGSDEGLDSRKVLIPAANKILNDEPNPIEGFESQEILSHKSDLTDLKIDNESKTKQLIPEKESNSVNFVIVKDKPIPQNEFEKWIAIDAVNILKVGSSHKGNVIKISENGITVLLQYGVHGSIRYNVQTAAELSFNDLVDVEITGCDFQARICNLKYLRNLTTLRLADVIILDKLKPDENYYIREFSFGVAAFALKQGNVFKGNFGIINENLEIILKPTYESILDCKEGLLAFKQNGLWGFLNTNGDVVIREQFVKVGDFSEGFAYAAKVKPGIWNNINQNLGFGIIDKLGNELVPFTYDGADNFKNGIARVFKTGHINTIYYSIDKKGIATKVKY